MFEQDTRFLVIDDTRTVRSMIREALKTMGYNNIEEAPDGEAAWDMMEKAHQQEKPYGFIFCDWNMPGMSGIELLEKRNNDPRFEKVPFLMVTIESEKEYVIKAVAMGVSDFIVKPFSEATIKSKMQGIYDRLNR